MDISTIIGVITGVGLVFWGVTEGDLLSILLNWHGLAVVVGGTMAAAFISSPMSYLWESFKAFFSIFFLPKRMNVNRLIALMIRLARQARTGGILSLQLAPGEETICGGFLDKAVQISREQGQAEFVQLVLQQEINQSLERSRETVNIYRTMAVLSPMFGLLGTLIGIIQVLRELSNPQAVGTSMALAITSAFYGIFLSNLIFIPIAGKLRIRNLEELREKEIILDGVVEMLQGSIPLVVLRKLLPYRAGAGMSGDQGGKEIERMLPE